MSATTTERSWGVGAVILFPVTAGAATAGDRNVRALFSAVRGDDFVRPVSGDTFTEGTSDV